MYDQHYRGDMLYLMLYSGIMVFSLIASCYLQFRRANAIAPDVTSPVRLRRCTAAFLGAATLSYLLYMPLIYLDSVEEIKMVYFVGALLDFLTCFPLVIAILFTMLQDHRRPLWPIGVMTAPLVVGMMVCIATRSDDLMPVLYAYFLLLVIGLFIYMVRETRRYGRWLRDNFADLEHKEVWQSLVVLTIILITFFLYAFEHLGLLYKYAARLNAIILIVFLVWRVETLSDLSQANSQSVSSGGGEQKSLPADEADEDTANDDELTPDAQDKIGLLLQQYCVDRQLYLRYDLNVQQLSKTLGINRYYLSQYFSSQGTNYNAYINVLRINYFISTYQEAVASSRSFTIKELAHNSGYRSYSTFSAAFKQRMGMSVTEWMNTTAK